MQPSPPPAGWYPDPAGGPASRWWDGHAWAASAAAPAAGAWSPQPGPAQSGPVPSGPVQSGPVQSGQVQAWSSPATPYGYPVPQQNPYLPQGAPARPGNGLAFGAIGISVAYVALAAFVHFVLLGIVPILMAFRSRSRREPLAPVAIGAAVIAIVVSIYFLTRR